MSDVSEDSDFEAAGVEKQHIIHVIHKHVFCFIVFFFLWFVQHSFFCRLTEDKKSEKFFRVFYDRMKLAQLEIKATVTVNTSDLGNRKRDDESQDKEPPVRKKGRGSTGTL